MHHVEIRTLHLWFIKQWPSGRETNPRREMWPPVEISSNGDDYRTSFLCGYGMWVQSVHHTGSRYDTFTTIWYLQCSWQTPAVLVLQVLHPCHSSAYVLMSVKRLCCFRQNTVAVKVLLDAQSRTRPRTYAAVATGWAARVCRMLQKSFADRKVAQSSSSSSSNNSTSQRTSTAQDLVVDCH